MLFKALSCFALRDIDLTKIERCALCGGTPVVLRALRRSAASRPMRSNPITVVDPAEETSGGGRILQFGYLFYVDLVASTADTNTQNALRHLQVRAAAFAGALSAWLSTAPSRRCPRSCACSGATRWTTPGDTRPPPL